jgi:geranylgeranyl diphosphate synthase type II
MEVLSLYAGVVEGFLRDEIAPYIQRRSCSDIHEPMNYSLLAGGKRIRPVLTLLCAGLDLPAGSADGARSSKLSRALYAAVSLEAIHTYSLIHDDLPAMDNDDYRRGRPSCHKRYNEWLAILAGDALNTLAFELLLHSVDPEETKALYDRLRLLTEAAGVGGMICGQSLDLRFEKGGPGQIDGSGAGDTEAKGELLQKIHLKKTAAMIRASCEMGALISGANPEPFRRYGEDLGLLFQIADDILDVTGTLESLGKSAGKDAISGKLTYPALYGIDESRQRCEELVAKCSAESSDLIPGPMSQCDLRGVLAKLPEYIYRRES